MYLSFFTVYRLVELSKPVSRKTFQTMVQPFYIPKVTEYIGEKGALFKELFLRYVPQIESLPLLQGITFDPTWKALPNHPLMLHFLREGGIKRP